MFSKIVHKIAILVSNLENEFRATMEEFREDCEASEKGGACECTGDLATRIDNLDVLAQGIRRDVNSLGSSLSYINEKVARMSDAFKDVERAGQDARPVREWIEDWTPILKNMRTSIETLEQAIKTLKTCEVSTDVDLKGGFSLSYDAVQPSHEEKQERV